jgi:hypothetical protein
MGLLIIACNISWAAAPVLKESFPRLMGMNIGAKNYHDKRYQEEMSRLDIVILGFYPGWGPQPGASVQDVVLAIKQRNPHILVGQYTVLDEAYDNLDINIADKDKYFKLKKEAWWLRNSAGRKLQWTDENNAWMINITEWAKPDGEGRRYPEWLADRDYRMYFAPVPEFDIWYFDNINYGPRVVADWDLDGRDDDKSNPVIEAAYRRGHRAQWDSVRRLAPTRLLLGNTDNDLSYPEFVQALNGAFLEGIMGLKWSIETWGGWYKAMDRYWAAVKNTALPHLVGFNVWGDPEDYRFFRYAYASCLMGDGYFSFTDKNKVYSSVPWFDEYSIDLGNAIDPPQKVAGQNGIYKRAFKNGMAIVNPTTRAAEVDFSEPLYLLAGIQDKHVNNGKRVLKLTIDPKDGLILSRYPVVPRIYKSSAEDMRRLIH